MAKMKCGKKILNNIKKMTKKNRIVLILAMNFHSKTSKNTNHIAMGLRDLGVYTQAHLFV